MLPPLKGFSPDSFATLSVVFVCSVNPFLLSSHMFPWVVVLWHMLRRIRVYFSLLSWCIVRLLFHVSQLDSIIGGQTTNLRFLTCMVTPPRFLNCPETESKMGWIGRLMKFKTQATKNCTSVLSHYGCTLATPPLPCFSSSKTAGFANSKILDALRFKILGSELYEG